jgi:ribonuclease-3
VETDLKIFQDRLGYHFSDFDLLQRALTHSSKGTDNYERLEFLGDRVLGLVIADIVYKTFQHESEGGMAKRHSALACTETLAEVATTIGLQDVVILSDAERSAGGMKQENLLADSMEAIIGAIYLDRGLKTCHDVIAGLWGEKIHILKEPPIDSKTGLQEWAQARKLPVPKYEIINREGPDHAPVFHISVTVEGFDPQTAAGSSRRVAEKEAARKLFAYLQEHHWHE